jgi:hypothetical protein
MDDRRGRQEYAIVTQSVSGGGSRRSGPRRIGVAIVLLASVALVVVGFVGPRLSGAPNFDLGYFATPTPRATPSPSPTPTRPGATPVVTPLPKLTRPDDVPPLDGSLILAGDAIQRLDLATAEITRLQPMTLWQDAVIMDSEGRITCICIQDGFNDRGATRTVRLARVTGDATVSSVLATFEIPIDTTLQQPNPIFDVVVDRARRSGTLAVATRTPTDWRISIRGFDVRTGDSGPEVPIGRIALPANPAASPSPSPTPGAEPAYDETYLDGPHIRLSPDGRTAFVWAVGQHYSEFTEPVYSRGAWRIRFDADGAIEDVAAIPALTELPEYCGGMSFVGPARFGALCARAIPNDPSGAATWSLEVIDSDGRSVRTISVPAPGDYGWGEPLVDAANGRMYLWDPVKLAIVRIDIETGATATTTFDSHATSAAGVTSWAGGRDPEWRDADSAMQQSMFEQIAGDPDGTRLFTVGIEPQQMSDVYSQKSLGVFVIDPATLALLQHWQPVANDTLVVPLGGGRVAVGATPGLNAQGDQVPWGGSLTVRSAADGRILARYGGVSVDNPPLVIRP